MTALLYIIENLRSLLISFFGFFMVYTILGKTAGLRFGLKTAVLVVGVFWIFRYFGITLYFSTYLAGMYSGEPWFESLLALLMLLNVWLGIMVIVICYKGNLLKNLLLEAVMEMFYVTINSLSLMALDAGIPLNEINMMTVVAPKEIVLALYLIVFSFLAIRYSSALVKRFMDWEPRYPAAIAAVLATMYIFGMLNSISYATTRGNVGVIIFILNLIIVLSYLWVSFFHDEMMNAMKMNHVLIRQDAALRSHYQQAITQSTRINHYNTEISRTINELIEKSKITLNKTDKKRSGYEEEAAALIGPQNSLKEIAHDYLESLENHYEEISVSKYSTDPGMNELLLSSEKMFIHHGIPVQFRFYDYHISSEMYFSDMENLFSYLCDQVLKHYQKELSDEREVIFQGGTVGKEMIISCKYPGEGLSGNEKRKLRSLCRRLQAEVSFMEENRKVKIIIGKAI